MRSIAIACPDCSRSSSFARGLPAICTTTWDRASPRIWMSWCDRPRPPWVVLRRTSRTRYRASALSRASPSIRWGTSSGRSIRRATRPATCFSGCGAWRMSASCPSGVHLRFESAGDASPSQCRRPKTSGVPDLQGNPQQHRSPCERHPAVHVDLTVAPRELHLRVTDDGVGWNPAGTAEGHGLRSMQRRASEPSRRHRGDVAAPGTGTCVTLTVPVR